jgi:two-component system, cell cycle sensor histidine kinase PleC
MSSFGRNLSPSVVDAEAEWKAATLALALPTFTAATTCIEAYDWFNRAEPQIAAAVVGEGGEVLGIVNRLRFLSRYAQRYVPELYGRKSITQLANTKPLIVDEHIPVEDLGAMITLDCPDALRECFVVTRKGVYLGIGTSEALVRSKVALLMARQERLNEALLAAEDADRTKSNFLALMSHELRTPLNAIIGFSEVLSGELFGPHQVARYGEYARDIHGAGKHLLALINDILDLSKSEAGKMELCLEEIDLPALFKDCMRLIGGRAEDRKLTASIAVNAGLPPLRGDELRLKQVLLNLLSNAVKFTMPGGKVEVGADMQADGSLLIRVRDTGIGMAPEMIPMALEPFRQLDSPIARNVEGTGLGLSLAKSLTEQQGGTLSIQSAPNEGTTVRLVFPPACVCTRQAADAA